MFSYIIEQAAADCWRCWRHCWILLWTWRTWRCEWPCSIGGMH